MIERSRQFVVDGERHRVFKRGRRILVDHTDKHGGKWDVIDLTETSGARTIKAGIKAVKDYHGDKNAS